MPNGMITLGEIPHGLWVNHSQSENL